MVLFIVTARSRFSIKLSHNARNLIRYIQSNVPSSTHASPNPGFVNSSQAPTDFHRDSAFVYEEFLTPSEGEALFKDISLRMRRKRFEKGHWDAVISDYKEVEISIPSDVTTAQSFPPPSNHRPLSPESCGAIERVRNHIERTHFEGKPSSVRWLPCHAIHLKKDGMLSAHVDSVRYSGGVVAGISLLSSSVMRLKPASDSEIANSMDEEEDGVEGNVNDKVVEGQDGRSSGDIGTEQTSKSLEKSGHVDLYLPPLSLYILTGVSRYRYTHGLLPTGSFSVEDNVKDLNKIAVDREDRISIVFRDAKDS